MSYLAVYRDGRLVIRRELSGPLVVGRARDADLFVPDSSVSRRHCRIEPAGDGWVLVDLGSRNGTHLGERRLERHVLSEGDEWTIGETVVRFHNGKMPPNRPADPEEAMEALRASGEAGREERIPESWKGPLPKPQARPGFPGQAAGGAEDMPTGSTMLGREGVDLVVGKSREMGPPPEMRNGKGGA